MNTFSIWHWLIVVLFAAIPLALVVGIKLFVAGSRRQNIDARPVEQRLAALDALHAQGRIDAAEHARERQRVLGHL